MAKNKHQATLSCFVRTMRAPSMTSRMTSASLVAYLAWRSTASFHQHPRAMFHSVEYLYSIISLDAQRPQSPLITSPHPSETSTRCRWIHKSQRPRVAQKSVSVVFLLLRATSTSDWSDLFASHFKGIPLSLSLSLSGRWSKLCGLFTQMPMHELFFSLGAPTQRAFHATPKKAFLSCPLCWACRHSSLPMEARTRRKENCNQSSRGPSAICYKIHCYITVMFWAAFRFVFRHWAVAGRVALWVRNQNFVI